MKEGEQAVGICEACGLFLPLVKCGICGKQLCSVSFAKHINDHKKDAQMHKTVHSSLLKTGQGLSL